MAIPQPSFTIGIEEEYLLVDLNTRQLASTPPEALFQRSSQVLGSQVTHEFLQAQIEVGTKVCQNMQEAREQLQHLRSTVSQIAADFDLGIMAASTHPFAYWNQQQHTPMARYDMLEQDLQGVVRRLVTCGMHVHVGIDDDELRIDLMNQASYFLPHLLALSTSSPFWGGDDTGLKSYRLSVFNELPRTGLPEQFSSYAEYDRHVSMLVDNKIIGDASMLWWDLRPSNNFPTLEMRITDVCTRLDDAVCIAALYLSTLKMLHDLRLNNQRWRQYSPMLIRENRWRAQRYGISEGLIDFGRGECVPFRPLVQEWLGLINAAAVELDCELEVQHALSIVERGTSADVQKQIFQQSQADGNNSEQALIEVVDWLIHQTKTV